MRAIRWITYLVLLTNLCCRITQFNQPRENVWVTLANITNQSSFCLSMGGVTSPFSTCLTGVPVWKPEGFCELLKNQTLCKNFIKMKGPGNNNGYMEAQKDGYKQCLLVRSLNTTLQSPPEKLDLFGSANASLGNFSTGGWFSFIPLDLQNLNNHRGKWASLDSSVESGMVASQLYSSCDGSKIIKPLRLPKGVFLIRLEHPNFGVN